MPQIMGEPVRSAFSVEGEGAPLILIHGIGASRHSWDGIVDRLRSKYRCITYDLRGHGRSPVPPTPYSLDDLVDDLEALRSELGLVWCRPAWLRWRELLSETAVRAKRAR